MFSNYELFQSWDVALFKIPPGRPSVSNWNLGPENIVWKGRLSLLEQYQDPSDDEDEENASPVAHEARQRLICKVEFYNMVKNEDHEQNEEMDDTKNYRDGGSSKQIGSNKTFGEFLDHKTINGGSLHSPDEATNALTRSVDHHSHTPSHPQLWAEVWFVPQDNVYDETIQMCTESPQYYKVIVQFPGTGCDGECTRVALGLKFRDRSEGMLFGESVNIFKRRYKDWQGDMEDHELLRKLAKLSLDEQGYDDDDDDEDFGEYIGADS
jgi:hypothetical protein